MPKNPFQRPQPINHSHKVPRHGLQKPQPPQRPPSKGPAPAVPALPSLETLLKNETHN